jgi:TolA-binding protein
MAKFTVDPDEAVPGAEPDEEELDLSEDELEDDEDERPARLEEPKKGKDGKSARERELEKQFDAMLGKIAELTVDTEDVLKELSEARLRRKRIEQRKKDLRELVEETGETRVIDGTATTVAPPGKKVYTDEQLTQYAREHVGQLPSDAHFEPGQYNRISSELWEINQDLRKRKRGFRR